MIRGIVRKIDDLGRITLPREYRRTLGIVAGEQVDMWLDEDIIRLKLWDKNSPKGSVRHLDDLGRICMPKEYRRTLGIKEADPVDMYLDGCIICAKPVRLQCVFCGSDKEEQLVEKNGVHVCKDCVRELFIDTVQGVVEQ